jgi:hypothetical protein
MNSEMGIQKLENSIQYRTQLTTFSGFTHILCTASRVPLLLKTGHPLAIQNPKFPIQNPLPSAFISISPF